MHTAQDYSLPSQEAISSFVRDNPFGVLSTHHSGVIHTAPLPIDLRGGEDGRPFLAGHVARANRISEAIADRASATITVLGPDTYVPPEWYANRRHFPTWLYCAVEISGRFEPQDSAGTLEDVGTFIDRQQTANVEASSWHLGEMPTKLTAQYVQAIFGFRLTDLQFRSCFRLNQRKSPDDRESLATSLGASDIAARRVLSTLVSHPPTEETT